MPHVQAHLHLPPSTLLKLRYTLHRLSIHLFISTMPTVQIDHCFYPHIIDPVLFFAPRASLLVLRASCKGWRGRADALLVEHLSLPSTSARHPQDPIPHGYDRTVPPLVRDVEPRRLPPVDLEMLVTTSAFSMPPSRNGNSHRSGKTGSQSCPMFA